jgi:hypothetical protein
VFPRSHYQSDLSLPPIASRTVSVGNVKYCFFTLEGTDRKVYNERRKGGREGGREVRRERKEKEKSKKKIKEKEKKKRMKK